MATHGEARIVGQVTAAAIGLVLGACALSACVSTTARPHPEPQVAVSTATTTAAAPATVRITPAVAPTGSCFRSWLAQRVTACPVPGCTATGSLTTAIPPLPDLTRDLAWRGAVWLRV